MVCGGFNLGIPRFVNMNILSSFSKENEKQKIIIFFFYIAQYLRPAQLDPRETNPGALKLTTQGKLLSFVLISLAKWLLVSLPKNSCVFKDILFPGIGFVFFLGLRPLGTYHSQNLIQRKSQVGIQFREF